MKKIYWDGHNLCITCNVRLISVFESICFQITSDHFFIFIILQLYLKNHKPKNSINLKFQKTLRPSSQAIPNQTNYFEKTPTITSCNYHIISHLKYYPILPSLLYQNQPSTHQLTTHLKPKGPHFTFTYPNLYVD